MVLGGEGRSRTIQLGSIWIAATANHDDLFLRLISPLNNRILHSNKVGFCTFSSILIQFFYGEQSCPCGDPLTVVITLINVVVALARSPPAPPTGTAQSTWVPARRVTDWLPQGTRAPRPISRNSRVVLIRDKTEDICECDRVAL